MVPSGAAAARLLRQVGSGGMHTRPVIPVQRAARYAPSWRAAGAVVRAAAQIILQPRGNACGPAGRECQNPDTPPPAAAGPRTRAA